jgi:ABC-type antimicrobial peptide transport system permease subunit
MSAGTLIARKSIRARWGRTLAILFAITASVSFVVGSFVLADSLRATFDDLFTELGENIDLEVRSAQEFDSNDARDPVDVILADAIRDIDGVLIVEPALQRYAQLLDADGEVIAPAGGPTLGVSWEGDDGIAGVTIKDGRPPTGLDELAIDKATADSQGFAIGDRVAYLTDVGRFDGTITATIGLGSGDSFGGAQVVALDLDTALVNFGADGKVDAIDIQVTEGADIPTVQQAIEEILPPQTEVVTGEQVAQETADQINEFVGVFGTGLLIFAFITAFVSGFIINNVFQITIGQRLRELALLRAVGASGRQVRGMIAGEAFILGVVATILGVFGGIAVANLLILLFNAAGAGFPDTQTVLQVRTVIIAMIVGVGITMASVIMPSRKASRIPPVAAMRPELGFVAMRTRRLVGGAIATVAGLVLFVIGLFLRPGGTMGLIALAGGGALLLFLGIASLSSTIAGPVTRAIGWPIQKLFKVPGALARENVARAPRRTSSSASALMIGVALVSSSAVFASSLRSSLVNTLESAITADYIVTEQQLPGALSHRQRNACGRRGTRSRHAGPCHQWTGRRRHEELRRCRCGRVREARRSGPHRRHDRRPRAERAVVAPGSGQRPRRRGRLGDRRHLPERCPPDAHRRRHLRRRHLRQLADRSRHARRDQRRAGSGLLRDREAGRRRRPGDGDAAVAAAMDPFPQANVQTNAEFLDAQEAQINQLLLIITLLLAFAILIAILGISITLALGVFERTREIGLLRAVGMNKRQTRRSVRWEAVIVSIFGALVGIVVGTFLGVVLSLAVPDDVISRLAFNPAIIVAILVGAVIAGLVAALYPSYKASNMNVLEAIATE